YELSNGHAVHCLPTGGSGSQPNRLGASVVGWDPAVKEAGVDTGYSPEPGTLRAPDVAVGNVPDQPGWVKGAPDLAIEYADAGQDEEKLEEKIADLLAACRGPRSRQEGTDGAARQAADGAGCIEEPRAGGGALRPRRGRARDA